MGDFRKTYGRAAVGYNRTVVSKRGCGVMRGRAARKPVALGVVSALVVLVAIVALLPATALARGRRPAHHGGGGGGHAAQKRIAITSSPGGGAAEGPVRAQVARALAKAKIKVVPQKKGTAPSDDGEWLALGQKLKVDGFVQLSFQVEKGKQSVDISVRTSSDGASLGTETFAAHGSPARSASRRHPASSRTLSPPPRPTAPAS